MHYTFFAGCSVSGVGGAMCIPVALPSGFPRGYMVLSHHLQVYTTILLCLVLVGVPCFWVFADCQLGLPHHPCLCSFCCGLGYASVIHTILAVVAFILLLSALCRLIGADVPHSSYSIGVTGVSPGVMVILQ